MEKLREVTKIKTDITYKLNFQDLLDYIDDPRLNRLNTKIKVNDKYLTADEFTIYMYSDIYEDVPKG